MSFTGKLYPNIDIKIGTVLQNTFWIILMKKEMF